jgi:bifunctional DNA-binding transcriptional regulator/antitoxin component of YhaV-PrlF toxin-antitoxin module
MLSEQKAGGQRGKGANEMTNLKKINYVNVTITTQASGQITIPVKVRNILDIEENVSVVEITYKGEIFQGKLTSGPELLTADFLPGGEEVTVTVRKIS